MSKPTRTPDDRRHQPLPGAQPKPAIDDPAAANAIARILRSESYHEADKDLGFLQEEQTRGLRLQLEYLKVEMLLRRYQIDHTIVVFGSEASIFSEAIFIASTWLNRSKSSRSRLASQ